MKCLRTVVSICLAIVLSSSGLHGLVLCIGEDGHVALKPARTGECHPHTEDTPYSENLTHTQVDDAAHGKSCGSCIDLELSSHAGVQKARALTGKLPRTVLLRTSTIFSDPSVNAPLRNCRPELSMRTPLRLQTSVELRI